MKQISKKWITIGIIVLVVIIIFMFFKTTYNKMVTYNESIKEKWSQVVTDYQRRLDLIPNLVNTVKGYSNFEKQTLVDVVNARAKATSVNIDPSKLDETSFKQLQSTQGELSSALSRLLVVVEQYPDLKASKNYLELQAQLEGTENRIANARRKFNEATKEYNTYIRRFPQNILAGMYNFTTKPYFEAEAGAEKAPKVEF
jgi:LemA protein